MAVDIPSPAPRPPLHLAFVQLDEGYTQQIVVEALKPYFKVHPLSRDLSYEAMQETIQSACSPTTDHRILLWMEYEQLDWERILLHDQSPPLLVANAYCIRKGLIRKAQLAMTLNKYIRKHPDSILVRAIPETFILQLDHIDYLDEALNDLFEVQLELEQNLSKEPCDRALFILKPSMTNKGQGLYVVDTEKRLRLLLESFYQENESDDADTDSDDPYQEARENGQEDNESENGNGLHDVREWVIQRYIQQPLLLESRKFHIRAYVVAVGRLQVYLYEPMLVLYAAHRYPSPFTTASSPFTWDLDNLSAHLTNTCLHEHSPAFKDTDFVRRMDEAIPDTAFRKHLLSQMQSVLWDLFESVAHEVTSFQAQHNCFEVFGMDFMVDREGQVYFLEANAFPGKCWIRLRSLISIDFKQTGSRLSGLIKGLFDATVALVQRDVFQEELVEDRVESNDDQEDKALQRMHLVYKWSAHPGGDKPTAVHSTWTAGK